MTEPRGETDLRTLLERMAPRLRDEAYVFCTVAPEQATALWLDAIAAFREDEGVTLVLPATAAEAAGLRFEGAWACITLTVHSSLTAIGFLAAISRRLADGGISLNPIAGYHHDHLFVPWAQRHAALTILASFRSA